MHENTIVIFDDFYHDDQDLIKNFGCNNIVTNLEKKYKVKYLPNIDNIVKKIKTCSIGSGNTLNDFSYRRFDFR